ncbi:hypothetical protein ACQJ0Y_11160 [Peribacillus simplex]
MGMKLPALHWIYVVFIALIIGLGYKTRNTRLKIKYINKENPI